MTPAPEQWVGPVRDTDTESRVLSSTTAFRGRVWDVRSDEVEIAEAVVRRDYVLHSGAVGVIALDDDDRVLLIRQYRHPVARSLFEPPAGLLDVAGESPLHTAQRELIEEAGCTADSWHVLVDYLSSPGGSTEFFRTYLARGLTRGERQPTGEAEERDLPQAWVGLDEARDLVLAGEIQNPAAVMGILAAWTSRADGWRSLRPADTPWPSADRIRARRGTPTS